MKIRNMQIRFSYGRPDDLTHCTTRLTKDKYVIIPPHNTALLNTLRPTGFASHLVTWLSRSKRQQIRKSYRSSLRHIHTCKASQTDEPYRM